VSNGTDADGNGVPPITSFSSGTELLLRKVRDDDAAPTDEDDWGTIVDESGLMGRPGGRRRSSPWTMPSLLPLRLLTPPPPPPPK